MVVCVPKQIVIAFVVADVINHTCLPVAVFEVRAQWMLSEEHPPVAPPPFVVVQREPLGMRAWEVVGVGGLVRLAVTLSGMYQAAAPLVLASMGGLMGHRLLFCR